MTANLQTVTEAVVLRAEKHGSVVASDIRAELARAGLSEDLCNDVVAMARASLSYRRGRYYFSAPFTPRVLAEKAAGEEVAAVIAGLIGRHRAAAALTDRREQGRVDFVVPVEVVTEDGRTYTLMTRDISPTGVRLIGTRRLLGQKVRVRVPSPEVGAVELRVQVLWTSAVGEDMVENGGSILGAG